jgi:hypothetical protein
MRVLLVGFLGAITGAIGTDIVGPAAVKWWVTPAVPTSTDCANSVADAMHRLVMTQLISTILGAALFTGLYLIFFRHRPVQTSAS